MIEVITNILYKVPDAVWAAIIASLLTLGGVIATNAGNNKRLKSQLEHDAAERENLRLMDLELPLL